MTDQKRLKRGAPPVPVGSYISFLGHLPDDPFAALDRLGQLPPFWIEDPRDVDGYWVVTRYEDVREVLQDPETFSSVEAQIPFVRMAEPLLPTETDPPDTQKLRALVMPLLNAKRMRDFEPRMSEIAAEVLGGFRGDGRCDVVDQFAGVFPVMVFIELFGLPAERRSELRGLANRIQHSVGGRAQAWTALRAIIEREILARRETPRDDLLSALANATVEGELPEVAITTNLAATVFLGGLDTLPSNIAWCLRFLAENPEHRRQIVAAPEMLEGAVEEFLRLYSVANPMRRVTRDVEFHGANMMAGDRVQLSIAAANRDASVFSAGADFRRQANPHLAFATGPHRCLGSHLARQELGVALRVWHELIPDYRIARKAELKFQGPVFSMETLPLEWGV